MVQHKPSYNTYLNSINVCTWLDTIYILSDVELLAYSKENTAVMRYDCSAKTRIGDDFTDFASFIPVSYTVVSLPCGIFILVLDCFALYLYYQNLGKNRVFDQKSKKKLVADIMWLLVAR